MECSQIRAILFENADTEIPVELRKSVEEHLAGCGSCALHLEALKEQSYALRSLPKVEAPGDFLDQVRSRVEKPSMLLRLKQGLSVLFAGKRFFRLAGVAATAALVIITVQVALKDDGGRKASISPPSPSVKAQRSGEALPSVESPGSAKVPSAAEVTRSAEAPASVETPRPGETTRPVPGPPASPGKKGNAFNSAALPALEPHRPAGVEDQTVALTVKSHLSSTSGKTHGGAFGISTPGASSRAGSEIGAIDQRVSKPDVSKRAATSGGASEKSSSPEGQKISSEVIRLIERADGKVLSTGPALNKNHPGTLLAEMPAANYPSFLDQLDKLGEVEFKGDKEFRPAPDTKIRVSVSFE